MMRCEQCDYNREFGAGTTCDDCLENRSNSYDDSKLLNEEGFLR